MKKLLIVSLTIYLPAMASYIPESSVGQSTDGMKIFTSQQRCQEEYEEPCISIRNIGNPSYAEIRPETQMKEVTEACTDDADCQSKLEAKLCERGYAIKNLDTMEVYCTWVRPKSVVENTTLRSQYEADKAAKESQAAAVASQLKDMDFGRKLYAQVILLNKNKGLSRGQRRTLRTSLEEIRNDLLDGEICGARSDIAGLSPDGTLIRQEDLDQVLALIDSYKNCQ